MNRLSSIAAFSMSMFRCVPRVTIVCYRAGVVSWILPSPMLLCAAAIALTLTPTFIQRLVSAPHLVVETVAVTLAAVVLVWACWVALWLVEKRW
jgi:hypothetical protein